MSAFDNISKNIGWEPREVEIPTVNNAKILLKMVKERHCRHSFKRVFEIHRFAKSAETNEQTEAMKIIYQAFEIGTEILTRYFQ